MFLHYCTPSHRQGTSIGPSPGANAKKTQHKTKAVNIKSAVFCCMAAGIFVMNNSAICIILYIYRCAAKTIMQKKHAEGCSRSSFRSGASGCVRTSRARSSSSPVFLLMMSFSSRWYGPRLGFSYILQ